MQWKMSLLIIWPQNFFYQHMHFAMMVDSGFWHRGEKLPNSTMALPDKGQRVIVQWGNEFHMVDVA